MSTGAPLNLPKPKATTNTGQDLIEIGNSLQAINDKIKNMDAGVGRQDIWDELTVLYTGTGTWSSRFALLNLSTNMLHINFQISGISPGIQPGSTTNLLRIPRGRYGGITQYSPYVAFSVGQLVLQGSTGDLQLVLHSSTPVSTVVRVGMVIALA